jgi:hypothetical protein
VIEPLPLAVMIARAFAPIWRKPSERAMHRDEYLRAQGCTDDEIRALLAALEPAP